ncbi:helicase-related protein [Paenibacillus chondroitinus]|uniref:Helicase-related protein n=1 Tax=Paenibacillus chondroitinus TaxID=59842 RepID=A0ABU6DCA6_9BACL|nr:MULTISPECIES: helicase-related protein [Paenibacillus]MCY9660495.1 DEAD/DEAH box helicase family protein [Paenibacillus anseongense]MEB4795106.1 helicase-related protein [Paenibacillus chondroitinus]
MKVQLYAVCLNKEWNWHLTIHPMTDIQYWFEQYAADAGLVLFEPFISFGQGVRLLGKLKSANLKQTVQNDESMLRQFHQAAKDCGLLNCDKIAMKKITFREQGLLPRMILDYGIYTKVVLACSGRTLLVEEFEQLLNAANLELGAGEAWMSYLQLALLNGDIKLENGLHIKEYREWRRGYQKRMIYSCKRCGSGEESLYWSACHFCGQDCPYCEACLTMGRVRFCSLLISGGTAGNGELVVKEARQSFDNLENYIKPWGLSEAQTRASLEGLQFITGERGKDRHGLLDKEPRKFLIWAVTGAGKTEMIFPFVHLTVANGGRVLIATPRKDVVLELQPRISRAFSDYSVVTLYGGSEQRWEQGQITIATTHQLMRFDEAFDLVIIDEIDAFPYHNNPMLAYAAAKVCKRSGVNILLSATPPKSVRQAAERGHLPHVRVPVRFHKSPLPVPVLIVAPSLNKSINTRTLPNSLIAKLAASVERGAQLFVFVPNIRLVEPTVELLRVKLQGGNMLCIEGTSSKDSDRTERVQRFRNRDIRVLVTTTILERGVTVPKSDVFILDADSKLFDEAALVQMAGRAGRSKDDPAGKVYFAAKEITRSQKEAIRQIEKMNRIARKRGYFERRK